MTYPSGKVTLVPQDRLFEPMKQLVLIVDALFTAVVVMKEGSGLGNKPKAGSSVNVECLRLPTNVRLPMGGPVLSIANNQAIGSLELEFHTVELRLHKQDKKDLGGKEIFESTLPNEVTMNLVTPVFVNFYEKHRPWMQSNLGIDTKAWPQIFDFGRMVRNWISHNHGCVHFDNPNYPGVTWCHLTYTRADAGKLVIGGDLQLGELIVLMFEMGDELTRLGCPADP
jgi:hypothetical protein